MSPHRPPDSRQSFYQKHKQNQGQHGAFPSRKEIVFPSDSVEAVQPLLNKRRRLTAKDIGQTDPWRLMMALKSGLLAESTWALDTLSVLLFDDNTIAYFSLHHMPGLIEVLLEHFRRSLIEIFEIFSDLEITTEKCYKKEMLPGEEEEDQSGATIPEPADSSRLSDPFNFTLKTRHGKAVKIDNTCATQTIIDDKQWDIFEGFRSSSESWKVGIGDMTKHVMTHFESTETLDVLRKKFYGKRRACLKRQTCVSTKCEETKESHGDFSGTPDCSKEKHCENEVHSGNTASTLNSDISETEPVKEEHCSPVKQECSSDKSMDDTLCNTTIRENGNCDNCEESSIQVKEEPRSPGSTKDSKEDPAEDSEKKEEMSATVKEGSEGESSKDSGVESAPMDIDENREDAKSLASNPSATASDSVPTVNRGPSTKDIDSKIVDSIKRKLEELEGETEAYTRDQPHLYLTSDSREELARRCVCISTIFRNLSFVPGNDAELSKHQGLVIILGRLSLLHHRHPKCRPRPHRFRHDADDVILEEPIEEELEDEWWWDALEELRENCLVTLANIAGHLDMHNYAEEVCFPVLNGLLHWAVCPSAYAHDPMPSMSAGSVLTPQRLALEALCKLCVMQHNVDLLLATPPFGRLLQLLASLVKLLANKKEQVLREFSIVLLSSFVKGNDSIARAVALQHPAVALLVDFIEAAEQHAMQIANQHSREMLRDNPEMMGTSLDMLKRTASALASIAEVPENRSMFLHHQQRLLQLVMSSVLDNSITSHLADVLYYCSQDS